MNIENDPMETLNKIVGDQKQFIEADAELPFPIESLPELLKNTCKEYARVYRSPLDIVAPYVLGAYSSSLARGVVLETSHAEPTYPNLFIYVAANPGMGKGVGKRIFKPLETFQSQKQMEIRNSITEDIRNERKGDSDETFAEPLSIQENKKLREMLAEIEPRLTTTEFTPEGLAMELSKNKQFLSILNTDAASTISNMIGKGRNNFMGHNLFRNAYSGDAYSESNKVAASPTLNDPRISAVLVTTPIAMNSFFGNPIISEDGMLSRFLIAPYYDDEEPEMPYEKAVLSVDIDKKWVTRITENLVNCWWAFRKSEHWNWSPFVMHMEDSAMRLHVDFVNDVKNFKKSLPNGLKGKGLTERVAENAGRLALNFGHSIDPSKPINSNIMEDAIDVAKWFCSRSLFLANRLFLPEKNGIDSKKSDLSYSVKEILVKGPVTYADLKEKFKRKWHSNELRDLINDFLKEGQVVMWKKPNVSRGSFLIAQANWAGIPHDAEFLKQVPGLAA